MYSKVIQLYMYISILFQVFFPYRFLLQDVFLCYTPGLVDC